MTTGRSNSDGRTASQCAGRQLFRSLAACCLFVVLRFYSAIMQTSNAYKMVGWGREG